MCKNMMRKITLMIIYLTGLWNIVSAQNVEVVKRIKFGTAGHFNYWTEWDPNEGSRSGWRLRK